MLRPRVGQKEPPRLGSTICYGQTWARREHTKTRQYDLLRPRVARKNHQDSAVRFVTAKSVQKEPPRLGSPICYGQELARKSHQDSAVRFVTAKRGPERATKIRQYDLLTAKSWPERATKTRQYDLLRPNVGQKEPPKLGSTILLRPRVGQKEPPRLGSTICYGQELSRKSHQDSAVRFVTAKSWPERATKTRQYDLLRPTWARKSHQDSAVRFVTAKSWPERATKTRKYDLLRPNRGPERATKIRQYDLLRPRVGQIEPPRLGSTICYGQTWARKSHRDSAVRLLRPNVGQKEPPKLRFGRNKSYFRVLVALSGQLLAVTNRTAESWWLFLAHVGRNKSYCRVLVALSGQLLAVTNRTAESWWLFLDNSWP